MTAYELMIKTNHHIIKDGELTDAQKANIVRQLLAARSDERTKQNFYKAVNIRATPIRREPGICTPYILYHRTTIIRSIKLLFQCRRKRISCRQILMSLK